MKRTVMAVLGVLAVGSAVNLRLSTALAQDMIFPSPTPASGGQFGNSMAMVGTDRLLIGNAFDDPGTGFGTGTVYLFSTNGMLLTIFTNPTPAAYDYFGSSVAAVGSDRVLIAAAGDKTGTNRAGAAYLFHTNGSLLTTFTNPAPAAAPKFGFSVAAVGDDGVLIGTPADNTGATATGAAYLFRTNGTLLTTFTNPTATAYDYFATSVAAVGGDRVLIGAPGNMVQAFKAGAAYLFNKNGTLLATFTNPASATGGDFGNSVTAVGDDRVLIGAYGIGAAYLLSTNGTLLVTFTEPESDRSDRAEFGWSVTAVGSGRVLIGAPASITGTYKAGAAYLFNTGGTLLAIFTQPTPADYGYFGASLAAAGTDSVVITGAYGNSAAAYLFNLDKPPSLAISLDPELSICCLDWPALAEGWVLECTNALPSVEAIPWPEIPPPYQTIMGTVWVTVTNNPTAKSQFFRLHKP